MTVLKVSFTTPTAHLRNFENSSSDLNFSKETIFETNPIVRLRWGLTIIVIINMDDIIKSAYHSPTKRKIHSYLQNHKTSAIS